METERRIQEEYSRLYNYFKTLPESQLAIARPLIQNSAFMKVTLEDLQATINENGVSEEYQNGNNQYGRKASAELQAYNSLIKNFSNVQKQLTALLPEEERSTSNTLEELRSRFYINAGGKT